MATYTLELQDLEKDKTYNFVEIPLIPMKVFKDTLILHIKGASFFIYPVFMNDK